MTNHGISIGLNLARKRSQVRRQRADLEDRGCGESLEDCRWQFGDIPANVCCRLRAQFCERFERAVFHALRECFQFAAIAIENLLIARKGDHHGPRLMFERDCRASSEFRSGASGCRENLDALRTKNGFGDGIAQFACAREPAKRSDACPHRPRQRKRTEIDPGDDAQRAQRADHHFVDVVARNIFHDAATALRRDSVARNKLHSENEISGRAVDLPQWRIHARRDRAARRRAIRERDREWQKLPVFRKRARDFAQRNSRLRR